MADWADRLAKEIAKTLLASQLTEADKLRLDLVAAKLRLVRQEGIGMGIDRLAASIKEKPTS